MTSVFRARRRAEEFDSLVEQRSTGTDPPAQLAEYAALVSRLRDLPTPEPRPEFTAALREELLSAADGLLAPSDDAQRLALPARSRTRDRRLAVAVGGLAIVGATSSLAVASQSALPGDMLYPLKRAMENAETGIRTDDTARASSLLSSATHRLDEATELSRTGDLRDGPYVADTLADFSDQATEASDLLLEDYADSGDKKSVEQLRDFTATSMDTLTGLEGQLPEAARGELRHAAQVLAEIDALAERACPACSGGIDQIPAILLATGAGALPEGVVVPGNLVPEKGAGQGKQDVQRTGKQAGGQGAGNALPDPDAVPSDPGEGGSGAASGGDPGNLLGGLTDGLTGKGGKGGEPTSNDGLTGIKDVDETLDGVVDDVDDILPDLP
jgi:hypothetical protein